MSHVEGIYEPHGGFLLTTTRESAEYNEGNYEPRRASVRAVWEWRRRSCQGAGRTVPDDSGPVAATSGNAVGRLFVSAA